MATLPSYTTELNNQITETWMRIQAEAIDNILDATPVWAALREKGAFTPQVGGEVITRTIKYANKTASAVTRTSTFETGEVEMETVAIWTFRHIAAEMQRNMLRDRENQGEQKVKSYVEREIMAAREALVQKFEDRALGAHVSAEGGNEVQSLNDVVPASGDRAAGTFGGINRPTNYTSDVPDAGNTWWSPKYKQLSSPEEINLLPDMKNLYNTIGDNKEPPNLLITTQDLFEIYEEVALDISQIVKNEGSRVADLGFDVLKFKGKDMIWTPDMDAGDMLMVNTNYIEVVYDPTMWFDMTDWKPVANGLDILAQILAALNIISTQLRRHGRLYT